MFAKFLSTGRITAVLTLVSMTSAGSAHAQQNSLVFPWNSGYQSTGPQPPITVPSFTFPSNPPPPQAAPFLNETRDRSLAGEEQQEAVGAGLAYVDLRVPATAEIWFDDNKTAQTGSLRHYVTPSLESGRSFTYDIRARWTDPNGKVID